MIQKAYRPSRMKNGERIVSRLYRGKFRIHPRDEIKYVALYTTDKQVAQQRLREIVLNEQRERDGLIAPKHQREAAQQALEKHVEEFILDRRSIGRDEKYVGELDRKLRKMIAECGWRNVRHVTAESFCAWRAKQRKSPKTLNEYLNAICGLMNWLEPRVGANPLRHVQKVQTNGSEKLTRRAFTEEELQRLISVSGSRGVVYLIAARTGIRRGELAQIECRDVHVDTTQPFIAVRATIAKNHSFAMQPLTSDAVDALRELQSAEAKPHERVFAGIIPRMEQFRKDLKAAGIEYIDCRSERADFHALRKTLGTMLTLSGVGQRTVMELMRHSDMRLTAKTYTDAHMLSISDAMVSLMKFAAKKADAQIDSQKLVPESPTVSATVQLEAGKANLLTAREQSFSPSESAFVQGRPEVEENARCRVRTCASCV